MKLSKIKFSRTLGISVIPLFSALPMLIGPSSTFHETNKAEVRRGLSENDGGNWIVIYSKEFSHQEYVDLTAAIVTEVVTVGGIMELSQLRIFPISQLNHVIKFYKSLLKKPHLLLTKSGES